MPQTNESISYFQTLTQAGLEADQAHVYEALLQNGPLTAGRIHQRTPLKRGLVYKVLEELQALGLVTKKDALGKVAIFEPAHPLKLKELAETKEKQAKQAQGALEGVLPQLTSQFNLASGKPGVRFFEGRDGIWEVLKDSLTAKGEIYSYADIESIVKYINEINQKYVATRERLKIQKKGIVLDTPFNRKYLSDYHTTVTDVKLISYNSPAFESVMQIYDNKVSYITLSPDKMIGVIIDDPRIYQLHKWLFEWSWQHGYDLETTLKSSKVDHQSTPSI